MAESLVVSLLCISLPPDDLDLLELPNVIGHPRHGQLPAEQPPFARSPVPDRLRQVLAVALPVRPLDRRHVVAVPVVPHQAADEQLPSQPVLLRGCERVVQQQRVAHRLVDDAVQDVCKHLALMQWNM